MYPHRIHLRGPWDAEPLAHTVVHADGRIEAIDAALPPAGRTTMPARWHTAGWPDFAGRMRFRRRFQWPRPLDPHERLWLVCEGADYFSTFRLNGQLLGEHQGAFDPFACEITSLVRDRNQLVVDVDCPALAEGVRDQQPMVRGLLGRGGGLWGVVAVEVRRQAFLHRLQVFAYREEALPRLVVCGEAKGETSQSAELYVLVRDQTLHYQRVSCGPDGVPFSVTLEVPFAKPWRSANGSVELYEVMVELVDGATRLDRQVRITGFRSLKENAAAEIDLTEPCLSAISIERADREGTPIGLRLPLHGGYATSDLFRRHAVEQIRRIVEHLSHHPAITAWICHTGAHAQDQDLDEAVRAAVRTADPSRLAK